MVLGMEPWSVVCEASVLRLAQEIKSLEKATDLLRDTEWARGRISEAHGAPLSLRLRRPQKGCSWSQGWG